MLEEASAPLGRNAAPKFSASVSRADMSRTVQRLGACLAGIIASHAIRRSKPPFRAAHHTGELFRAVCRISCSVPSARRRIPELVLYPRAGRRRCTPLAALAKWRETPWKITKQSMDTEIQSSPLPNGAAWPLRFPEANSKLRGKTHRRTRLIAVKTIGQLDWYCGCTDTAESERL